VNPRPPRPVLATPEEIRALALKHAPEAIATLCELAQQTEESKVARWARAELFVRLRQLLR
jgi:hypothetical protein